MIVVKRKSQVQPFENRPRNMTMIATKPAAMPIRLRTVCSVVKADSDIPKTTPPSLV
jgi:hypothetical protein